METRRARLLAIATLVLGIPLACGGGSNEPGRGSGGAGGSGGSGAGGTTSTGGSSASGGVTSAGGSSASGGTSAAGGSVATGGAPSTGGKPATGGAGTGGHTGFGGGAASGGATGQGGSTATGGSAATGGGAGAGGATGSGGSAATGGATGSGGGPGSGGTTAAGGATGTGGGGGTTGAKLHAFLLLGQSNMAGYAKAQSSDKENSPRIRVLGFDDCSATGRKKDQWDDAEPPLHECWNSAVGPGDSFSKALLDKIPAADSILLVPCALSGQSMSVMKKGTSNYTWFISRAKSAQQLGAVIEGFIFHQGESDCGSSSWPATVKQFVTDLRTDLGLTDNPPFLAGELPRASACSSHNPLVNQLPGLITNAHVVSSEGLALDPADTQWRMHFGHDQTVELGQRYAAKMIEALGW